MVNPPVLNLVIREATVNDAILIADISHQTFYHTFADVNTEADMEKFLHHQFTKGKLILEVGMPENFFYLAYHENSIAGYVKLRNAAVPDELKKYRCLEIARIYSMPHFIGKGVGKLLMETSIDVAVNLSKEIIWLGVWEKNQRAIDFYTKWGFEKFAETDFLLGDDLQRDWLMKKSL
jgi:ribosomal protein S18 acetylase RimI-like enzyme